MCSISSRKCPSCPHCVTANHSHLVVLHLYRPTHQHRQIRQWWCGHWRREWFHPFLPPTLSARFGGSGVHMSGLSPRSPSSGVSLPFLLWFSVPSAVLGAFLCPVPPHPPLFLAHTCPRTYTGQRCTAISVCEFTTHSTHYKLLVHLLCLFFLVVAHPDAGVHNFPLCCAVL